MIVMKAFIKVGERFCMKCKSDNLAFETTHHKDVVQFVCKKCHAKYIIDWTGSEPRPLIYDPKTIQYLFDKTYDFI